jgi:serine/threonine protein kinase
VHRALDTTTSRTVALKVLDRGRTDFARFEREAEVLASVKHPAVVAYVAHGLTDEGSPYLAMEWLEGVNLSARLAQGALSVDDALSVVHRAAEGLGAAHALGVIHRDVKPSNLLLVGGRTDDTRVIDFGVARAPRSRLTSDGTVLGTPEYMAPEQAEGRALTPRVDVFALGCVLYACLVGESPFAAGSATATMLALLRGAAPRVRARREDVPDPVDALVARMLARDPAVRPADGREAADAVARCGDA